jgi:hypothetical protein
MVGYRAHLRNDHCPLGNPVTARPTGDVKRRMESGALARWAA